MGNEQIITVFGSHSPQPDSPEYQTAEELGAALANAGFGVASGGYGGTMEAVLRGAGGGIGFTADIFSAKPNRYVMKEISSRGLFDRIEKMLSLSSGLVCLQGGTGTLLELAAAWEMVNKKIVPSKPIICLGDFWQKVVHTLDSEPTIDNLRSLKQQDQSAASYIFIAEDVEETVSIISRQLSLER